MSNLRIITTDDSEDTQQRCDQNLKNITQLTAIAPGLLLLICGGIQIGWTFFNHNAMTQEWAQNATSVELILVQASFFVGAVVGGFNAGYFIDSIGRKRTLRFAILAIFCNGIIVVVFPDAVIAILLGRLFGGYGYGVAYLNMLVMAGEISSKYNRGFLTSFIYLSTSFGVFLFTFVNMFSKYVEVNFILGIITIVLVLATIPAYYFFSMDSHYHQIMKGRDSEGLQILLHLRRERHISTETQDEFQATQHAIIRESTHTGSIYKNRLFYIVFVFKLTSIVVSNQLLNMSRVSVTMEYVMPEMEFYFQPLLLTTVHFIAGVITLITIDYLGKHIHFTWMLRVSATLLFATAIVTVLEAFSPFVFIILFDISTGLGLVMAVDFLTTEAFSSKQKGIAISLLNFFHMLFHICIILVTVFFPISKTLNVIVFFVFAGLLTISSLMDISETKQMSLNEARNEIMILLFGYQF